MKVNPVAHSAQLVAEFLHFLSPHEASHPPVAPLAAVTAVQAPLANKWPTAHPVQVAGVPKAHAAHPLPHYTQTPSASSA